MFKSFKLQFKISKLLDLFKLAYMFIIIFLINIINVLIYIKRLHLCNNHLFLFIYIFLHDEIL